MAPNPNQPQNKNFSAMPKVIGVGALALTLAVVFYSLYNKNLEQNTSTEREKVAAVKTQEEKNFAAEDILKTASFEKNFEEQKTEILNIEDEKTEVSANQTVNQGSKKLPKNIEIIKDEDIQGMGEVDERFDQFKQIRNNLFISAMKSSSKLTLSKDTERSSSAQQIARPSNDASYEEKMAYYNKVQAQIRAQKSTTSSYKEKMKLAQELMGNYVNNNNSNNTNNNNAYASVTKASSTNWDLGHSVEKTKTLTINTGFVIPAVLQTAINSDLKGNILAMVSQNVYDTATGHHLLIPQGTKIFGAFSNSIQFGQERVFVIWNRLVFPNGQTLDLESMQGVDMAGASGFSDQVNNHYWKLFKGAFLLSVVTASVTYADNKYNNGTSETQSATSAMSEALGNELGQVTTELIRKHMNISPTIEIRNGYRFNIIVNKDIQFSKPYNFR